MLGEEGVEGWLKVCNSSKTSSPGILQFYVCINHQSIPNLCIE